VAGARELRRWRLASAQGLQKRALHSLCRISRLPVVHETRVLERPAYVGTALLEPT
jgi:hypothetical protein